MLTEPTTNLEKVVPEAHDFLPLLGTDHVELIVGNAKQSAYYYMAAWGFQPLAFKGLETGCKDSVSYALRQDKITLVLTTPLKEGRALNAHLDKHGDGVKSVALWVPDARKSFEETTKRGAEAEFAPEVRSDADGEVVLSAIKTYGDTIHVFVERENYNGVFLPGYRAWNPDFKPAPVGLKYIDHMVGNVGWGEMNTWCKFYAEVMGFAQLVFLWNLIWSAFKGEKAPGNPWNATTLEWQTAHTPPEHGNFGDELPCVYRWAYDYSVPGHEEDFIPQNVPPRSITA